ncbi:MAG: sulfite exporter TauE/SafE family protein [Trueperaceae bacterium]|nr:sulfite exporter TauE/SafE family protein [Trueperaceae bacterium]
MFSDYSAFFWFTAVLATLLVGIGKGGFGGAVGAIATPLIALSTSVPEAAALLLPVLLSADVFAVYTYRKTFDAPNLKLILPFATLGIIIASLFFTRFSSNERILKIGLGLIAVGFVIFQLTRTVILKRFHSTKTSVLWAGILGITSGFTSTLAHVGGPPMMIYLLPQNLPKDIFVGTNAILFFVINILKLLPYALLGLLSISNLSVSLVLIPVAFIGIRLGVYLNKKVSQKWFNLFIYFMLMVTGLELITGYSVISIFAR